MTQREKEAFEERALNFIVDWTRKKLVPKRRGRFARLSAKSHSWLGRLNNWSRLNLSKNDRELMNIPLV